jgi:hypothetical protein
MAESFLKEQLERIKRMTERMSAVEGQSERLANEMAHDREAMHHSPLHDVRDYRTYSPSPAESEPVPSARDSSPRRRRRR